MAQNRITTGKVRLSYVNVEEPRTNFDTSKPKYSLVILVDKKDTDTVTKIKEAQKQAIQDGLGKLGGKVPKNLKNTFRDGDEEADLDRNPEYEGHYFMSVNNTRKPALVDRQMRPIGPEEVYSGCYARVSLDCYVYDYQGTKGVTFGLGNIQKLADGEPLGSVTTVEDDFEPIDVDESEDDDIMSVL